MVKAEQQIHQAIEEGQFEDLPGKGKPLKLDENPHEDPEWRLAYRVLRNGGFTLPWIEARREIETELEAARLSIRSSWVWRENALVTGESAAHVNDEWRQSVELFRERIEKINQHIFFFNLQVPSQRFQLSQKDVEHELELTIASPSDKLPGSNM
jgi:DnaJ family protein C protein 28